LGIFFRIILPLLIPILATLSVLLSVVAWNDFFSPLFLLPHSDQATLPLGLYAFAAASQWQLNWNLILADVVFVSLPLVLVYVVAQRWIVSGLTAGGVRG
jgi:raffinose/stachyose/melibiose transport system permease protein